MTYMDSSPLTPVFLIFYTQKKVTKFEKKFLPVGGEGKVKACSLMLQLVDKEIKVFRGSVTSSLAWP